MGKINIDNNYHDLDMKIWKTEITFTIFILITLVYIFYKIKIFTTLPCNNDIVSVFIRNFIHVNLVHLLSNLAGLFILYKVETDLGKHEFFYILIGILLLNTLIEYIVNKSFPDYVKCSIGFSGVIFSYAVFELVTSSNFAMSAVAILVMTLTLPSLKSSNVSIVGHLIGVLAGLLTAIAYKYIK